ncbi:RidA family protein [Methanospirillum hungatei]|uniref:RidA family protein n=1 Tax=Methanospirillum hungatei TaxID=2203 RepID=UPI0026EB330A|nr:RidA family protein [Methanospirillum hungatei]MCA1916723.1 RidA family protein [Methanospirillum hungatei]
MDLKKDKNAILLAIVCIILGMVLMSLIMVLVNSSHKEIIYTDKAPKPIGPYSQGVAVNDYVYTSGQIGIDPQTGVLRDTIGDQTHQVMKNLREILEVSGLNFDDVVNTHIYLTNISDFPTVNEIYSGYMGNATPSRSTVGVASLPKGALVEIEMIAEKK